MNGIVRRIDKLGRIVLPRQIRKNFKIKEDTNFTISTTENGEIILKPFSFLEHSLNDIYTIFKLLKNFLKPEEEVLLVDNDRVLLSTKSDSKYINYHIPKEIYEILSDRKEVEFSGEKIAPFTHEEKIKISPIIITGDLFGGLIILNVKEESSVINFVKELIENSFD